MKKLVHYMNMIIKISKTCSDQLLTKIYAINPKSKLKTQCSQYNDD